MGVGAHFLCDDYLTFGEPDTEPPEAVAEREHWLGLMQFMHDSPAIAIDGYTIKVTGDYGHTFSFDMCNRIRRLGGRQARLLSTTRKQLESVWSNSAHLGKPNVLQFFMKGIVEHSLGAFWTLP